jgi:tetratricopeptide (TPR) repeat protein
LEERAIASPGGEGDPDRLLEPLFSAAERVEFGTWRNLARYQPAVVDYLKAQLLTAEKRYVESLACLERITEAQLTRPGLLLQTGDLYRKLGRYRDARRTYEKALVIDPDNPHAHLGLCRMALRRKLWTKAAEHALNCLQRLYHYPVAHFLLGIALTGMESYDGAAEAFRVAISINPNFPVAHLRLAAILSEKLGDASAAEEHRRLARTIRRKRLKAPLRSNERIAVAASVRETSIRVPAIRVGSSNRLDDSVIIVSGLPRSGTSMVMQMLAAGGIPLLSDGLREADEDNPRGYFEFEPARKIFQDSAWLDDAKGKAVKIVAPLLAAVHPDIRCRVILIERDLDEILDSQAKMIDRRGEALADTFERRNLLKAEFARTVSWARQWLSTRPETPYLILERAAVMADSTGEAARIAGFLGGDLAIGEMAAAVDVALHRNRGKATYRSSSQNRLLARAAR